MLNMIIVSKRTPHFNSKRKIIDIFSKNFLQTTAVRTLAAKAAKKRIKNGKKTAKNAHNFPIDIYIFTTMC